MGKVSERHRPRRYGSAVSEKQVLATVQRGRLVTFHNPSPIPTVVGYVCGVDDYHWVVIDPKGEIFLVHKSTPVVTLHRESTYDDEPQREDLEMVVGPFRRAIANNGSSATGEKDRP